jgi:hypothetical protein
MPQHAGPVAAGAKRRTYLGACDCGAVRYAIELDVKERDARTGSVWEQSAPASSFRLLDGYESVIGYQFAREDVHHFFCARCQTRAFSLCAPGGAAYYSVDLKALCGPALSSLRSAAPATM